VRQGLALIALLLVAAPAAAADNGPPIGSRLGQRAQNAINPRDDSETAMDARRVTFPTMRVISPALGPCLHAGATLTSNRQSLRAALAEAYYHRLHAPAEPPAVEPGTSVQ